MSIKQARPTTHYISRTRNDVKVRSSHADQEGRVFSWDDPPVGAHPGEDYNCRCTAEPYYPEISEFLRISIDGLDTKSVGPALTSLITTLMEAGAALRLLK